MMLNKLSAVFAALLILTAGSVAIADYDESVDGDLSDVFDNPDMFVLNPGSNIFIAQQQGDAFGRDVDYFTVTVPVGFELSALFLNSFGKDELDLAFLGIVAGDTFPFNFDDVADVSQLLGGIVFGGEQIGTDMLPEIGNLLGAQGFLPPLPSGNYTIWLNQTGQPTTSNLDFRVSAVPEPGTLVWLGIATITLAARRRRIG